MDDTQELLFGDFPRRVGVPHQWWVFSEGEFDVYTDTVNGVKNVYAAVARRPVGGKLKMDKVHYDFDSDAKDETGDWRIFGDKNPGDAEAISRMRDDPDVADAILGDVCEDVQKLAEETDNMNVPAVGVFSGFGIHFYQLYEEQSDPDKAVDSTAKRYIDEASLRTYDPKIVGEVKRIMRVPNCERVTEDGRNTNLFTIPLTLEEMKTVTPEWLVENSLGPREIDTPDASERPTMNVYQDYVSNDSTERTQLLQQEMAESVNVEGILEFVLKEYLKMPCMYERIQTANPDHEVRRNSAVLLFNLGMEPSEVHQLFQRIGWFDYDGDETKYQLKQLYKQGYSDMSCASIRDKGLCTRLDEPQACETFGWSGGEAEWKK